MRLPLRWVTAVFWLNPSPLRDGVCDQTRICLRRVQHEARTRRTTYPAVARTARSRRSVHRRGGKDFVESFLHYRISSRPYQVRRLLRAPTFVFVSAKKCGALCSFRQRPRVTPLGLCGVRESPNSEVAIRSAAGSCGSIRSQEWS